MSEEMNSRTIEIVGGVLNGILFWVEAESGNLKKVFDSVVADKVENAEYPIINFNRMMGGVLYTVRCHAVLANGSQTAIMITWDALLDRADEIITCQIGAGDVS